MYRLELAPQSYEYFNHFLGEEDRGQTLFEIKLYAINKKKKTIKTLFKNIE
jgi:hypothetical protein